MSISATGPRFINTPTVLMDYEADQQGYDAQIIGDKPLVLSREHDVTTGFESLYGVLLERHPVIFAREVSGNEGFIDTIKKGAKALIQAVKDFFKWLWLFFTGRSERLGNKTEDVEVAIRQNGVRTGEVPYPKSVFQLWGSATRPDTNLHWVKVALDDIEKTIAKAQRYITTVKAYVNTLNVVGLTDDAKVQLFNTHANSFYATISELWGVTGDGKIKLFGPQQMSLSTEMRLNVRQSVFQDPRIKEGSFKTDLPEVNRLVASTKQVQNNLDDLLKEAVTLEQVFIKRLEATLTFSGAQVTEAQDKAASGMRRCVRDAMATIKDLQTVLFRGTDAALSILKAAAIH